MKKIAVIGSINMDLSASAPRIPRLGETILADSLAYMPGGKGANQAVAAARLGGEVTFFGCVGEDAFGKKLLENLETNGVDVSEIEAVPGEPTGLAMITVAEGDNAITVVSGANNCATKEYIDRHLSRIVDNDIIVIVAEIPHETIDYLIRAIRTATVAVAPIIIFNPAPASPVESELLDLVTYLTPNEHEARIVLQDEDTPIEELVHQYQGRLIITCGSRGVLCYLDARRANDDQPIGDVRLIPAYPVEVVDTTGAGDTFNGALAAALATDQPLAGALRFANTAAALSCTKKGAQGGMPTLPELQSFLN